jgi:hypothetical protein
VTGNANGFIAERNFIYFVTKSSAFNADCDYLTLGWQLGSTTNSDRSFLVNNALPSVTTSGNMAVWDFWVKVDNYALNANALNLLSIES